MLGGDLAVLQGPPERIRRATIFDGLSFDPFALLDDGLCPAEVGIGGRDVVQALVIALMDAIICVVATRAFGKQLFKSAFYPYGCMSADE